MQYTVLITHVFMPCSHVVVVCKHAHVSNKNYIHLVYMLESVSNVYRGLFRELHKEAYWSLCHKPRIYPSPAKKRNSKGHLSPLVYTPKWISENQLNQNNVPWVASRPFKKQMPLPCWLKSTTLSLWHILSILKILLYCFKFKYFILFFVILYLFYNLNILVQFNLLVKYIFLFTFNYVLIIK